MKSLGYTIGEEMCCPEPAASTEKDETHYPTIYIHEKEVAAALELEDMEVGDEFTATIRFRVLSKGVDESEDHKSINAQLCLKAVDDITVDSKEADSFTSALHAAGKNY